MGLIHLMAAYADGGVCGRQSVQRDWSPFVAHFTSYSAMQQLKDTVKSMTPLDNNKPTNKDCGGATPKTIKDQLAEADKASFDVLQKIFKSKCLKPSNGKGNLPPWVCFSECTLPGLVGHCERYGRFGLVFDKKDLFGVGARPTAYVDKDIYKEIINLADDKVPASLSGKNIKGLVNVYSPTDKNNFRDFTHEREWRMFEELNIEKSKPVMLVAPSSYFAAVLKLMNEKIPIIPIDLVFKWGG